MPKHTLHLFPGAHKTGTTFLQSGLEHFREHLGENGLLVARRQRFYKSGLHKFISQGAALPDTRANVLHDVFNAETSDTRDLVISLENIFGEALPKFYNNIESGLARLADLFPEHEIKAQFYIRRQDEFAESLYLQDVHNGKKTSLARFINKTVKNTNLDWAIPVTALKASLGAAAVTVLPYDELKSDKAAYVGNFFKSFCPLSEGMIHSFIEASTQTFTNVSLSEPGLRASLVAYRYIKEESERREFCRRLRREMAGMKLPKFKLPEDMRHEIAEAYRAPNAAFINTLNISPALAKHYRFQDI